MSPYWLLMLIVVMGCAHVAYLERRRIRQWWRSRNPTHDSATMKAVPSPAPHEQYPEIMHWQKGDEIRSTASHNNFWFNLISITEDGMVYGKERLGDHKFRQKLWVVMRDGCNLSLKDREIDVALSASNEYMELIAEFNKAFKELQERDNKLKLVG